ncbi:hypothetical protein GCM10010038_01470 [Glutamicibacter protophormiae]|nr:hypothetical protein GCM10010038_01470 [Glutamicibacter protophormiae]
MHQVDTALEGPQASTGQLMRLLVTVQADQVEILEPLEHGLRMTTHAQGAVDDDCPTPFCIGSFNTRSQQIDATIQKYRNMSFRCWSLGILIRHCAPFRVQIGAEIRSPSNR